MERNLLTVGQLGNLTAWETAGYPTPVKKLGYSIGSRGNDNFHSTWAVRENEQTTTTRIYGDGRSTWRGFIRKYGVENVG